MTTLIFLLALAILVGTIVAIEGDNSIPLRRPTGLLQWLVTGNWPAKIGAALIVVGTGALLRYAAINIEVGPLWKVAAGLSIAALLGFVSAATRSAPQHRTLSLASGGAACGVAYLTAYSAFALHGYLDSTMGLGLLALTALVTGVFAVTRGALSVGLLAMVGAYLAPILSQGDPGPYVVYGYYAAISALTLMMVAARGWRPLIHLSFVFTLVSGVFFAWNAQYYSPAHFQEMVPMLLLLAALHVAMPIVGERNARGSWVDRVDYVYLLALPVIVALLAIAIAPSRAALALQLIGLAAIWLAAAGYLRITKREGAAAHAIIGALLLCFGCAARFRGAPWDVIALAAAVGALAISVRSSQTQRLHDVLAGIVLLLGAVHALTSLGTRADVAFLNAIFVERLIAAGLLIYAGLLARKVRQPLDAVLLYVGIGWAVLNLVVEVIRWNVLSLALTLHWLAILAAVAVCVFTTRLRNVRPWAIAIPIAIVATAPSAAAAASLGIATISLTAGIAALLAFALRPHEAGTNATDRIAAVIFIPALCVLWGQRIANVYNLEASFVALAAALSAVLTVSVGNLARQRSDSWLPTTAPIFGVAFSMALVYGTTVSIERESVAALTELACLAGLVTLALNRRIATTAMPWVRPAAFIGLTLLIQANVLRWLGPDGHLDASDITRMQWPALLSLLWAAAGSALAVWSRVSQSRTLWVGGAALLVAAAVKLALVDLGALGDLTNILAVIGAGGVFLLVGWLAPMPPAIAQEQGPAPARDRSSEKIGWTIAVIVSIALLLSRNSAHVDHVVARIDPDRTETPVHPTPPPASTPSTPPQPAQVEAEPTRSEPPMQTSDVSERPAAEPEPATEAPATNVQIDNACTRFAAQLPTDYDVYVAGAPEGRPMDVAVGGARGLTDLFDVAVHASDRPVVLVLAAGKASLWMVRSDPETNIAGVWLTGDSKHQVIGVPAGVPVMKGADAQHDCGSVYISDGASSAARELALDVFGREPKAQILAKNGDVTIGRSPARAREPRELHSDNESSSNVASYPAPAPSLPGDRGIQQLMREGKLKAATMADYKRWVRGPQSNTLSAAPGGTYLWRTYLVTGPITFPSDLYGAHRAVFILLPGVPYPEGNPGHSQVIQGQ